MGERERERGTEGCKTGDLEGEGENESERGRGVGKR